MSGSLTFNCVSSYRVLKSLTSFIHHRFSCHQRWSWTESFPGCLPTCLLSARKFFSGLHPTYPFGMKKMIIRHALGKAARASSVRAQPQRVGGRKERRCFAGRGDRSLLLFGSTAGKTAPPPCTSLIWPLMSPLAQPQAVPARGWASGFFPFSAKVGKAIPAFSPAAPIASYRISTKVRECFMAGHWCNNALFIANI